MLKNYLIKYFRNLPEYRFFLLLFIFSLVIYVAGIIRVKSLLWGDSLYYYAYTHSIIIDRDIDFENEAYRTVDGFPNKPEISQITHKVTNKFSPGTAIAWIPGFVVGQAVAYTANLILGLGDSFTNGYGILTQFFVAISSVAFSVTGLWLVYKTIKEFFEKEIAVLSCILLFFTTPLFYYTAVDPLNSHSISFLLSSILVYQVAKLAKTKTTWVRVIKMGIVAGLLLLVRNQDAVIVLPVFLYLVFAKKESLLDKLNWATLFAGFAFVVFSIQAYVTLNLFGILGSPYLIRGEVFSWLKPDFFRVLFSFENGLFFFSPVLLLAVGALLVSFLAMINKWFSKHLVETWKVSKEIQALVVISLVSFILQLYIVASWAPEILGGPYGSRMFVSILPHLSIGIAIFLTKVQRNLIKRRFLFSMIFIILFLNMLLQTLIMLYRF